MGLFEPYFWHGFVIIVTVTSILAGLCIISPQMCITIILGYCYISLLTPGYYELITEKDWENLAWFVVMFNGLFLFWWILAMAVGTGATAVVSQITSFIDRQNK